MKFISMIFLVETPFFFLMADSYLMTLSFGLLGGLVYESLKNFLFYTLVVKEGAGVVLLLSISTVMTIYYTCRGAYSLRKYVLSTLVVYLLTVFISSLFFNVFRPDPVVDTSLSGMFMHYTDAMAQGLVSGVYFLSYFLSSFLELGV